MLVVATISEQLFRIKLGILSKVALLMVPAVSSFCEVHVVIDCTASERPLCCLKLSSDVRICVIYSCKWDRVMLGAHLTAS